MNRIHKATSYFVATQVFAALAATPSFAAERSFNIMPKELNIFGGAILGGTVALPNEGLPGVGLKFVVPRDYQKNSIMKLNMILNAANGGGAACAIVFEPNSLQRARHNSLSFSNLSGFAAANGSTRVGIGAGRYIYKEFNLGPAGIAPFADMNPGDLIFIQMQRNAAATPDSCAVNAFLHAIEVTYTPQSDIGN